jgi:hypothetical protein
MHNRLRHVERPCMGWNVVDGHEDFETKRLEVSARLTLPPSEHQGELSIRRSLGVEDPISNLPALEEQQEGAIAIAMHLNRGGRHLKMELQMCHDLGRGDLWVGTTADGKQGGGEPALRLLHAQRARDDHHFELQSVTRGLKWRGAWR